MKYRKLIVLTVVLSIGIFALIISRLGPDRSQDQHDRGKSSQVTVWGDRFEIFLEHPFIVANTPTRFVTHVSDLVTLEPRRKGPVTFILRHASETPIEHVEQAPARDGIYIPELTFPLPGQWSVSLIIGLEGKDYLVELPEFKVYGSHEEVDRAPSPEEISGISFLKEQQWEIPTGTEPVRKWKVLDSEVLAVPESALVEENGMPMVFVQVAGETFQKRCVKIGGRANGFVEVLSCLSEGEYVTTKGAYVVARAEHGEESAVHLSDEQIRRFGIEVSPAGPGDFKVHKSLPGQIVINTDRMVHIVPRVRGIVREVKKKLGDSVKKGEVMAVIESRDLADAKATYLASIERLELANTIFEREKKLWKQKISSEQEYLDAKKIFAEAKIAKRSAEQKLRALGFNAEYLKMLPSEPAELLTTFEITAPFDGTIIQKHISLGEVIKDDVDVFVVADLDTVWVDLQVHQKDAGLIKKGQEVIISATSSVPETKGVIEYVEPVVNQKTRRSLARIVLDNTSGQLRPGTFITANVLVEKRKAELVVAKAILQDIHDNICVFVKNEHCFEARPVTVGRSNGKYVEIVSGIRPGEKIVTNNSFRLKAELEKSAGGGHAGHGHAH
ncbi:MAG: efflux RND transporter periplasmic adaptor subunit [Planctomycetes bacterium]|nr:efflux RND transporter periplasmic adaptor subunit [Planctomycetota bacterium]